MDRRARWLGVVAAAVVIGNLLDAVFTLIYTHVGLAEEANPLLRAVLADSPVRFMLVKLGLVSMGVALLWRLRRRRSAVAGLVTAGAAYVWLVVYHLSAVSALVAIAP
ncbi:MAG: DUF5658 family protein [Kofleriaceae bacterium]